MEVYFDNSSTTKMYDSVIDEVTTGMKEFYGNPSALHTIGLKSDRKLKECRKVIADIINADEHEIIFNSGASEGNNFILKGFLNENKNIITTPFEHSSILNTLKNLSNINVKVLSLDNEGKIDLNELENLIDKDTALVSIIHVNNEIGTIQDLEKIGKIIKGKSERIKFHADCVQSFSKFDIDVKKMNIDFLTSSAHKYHGPKGCGFIYIKKGIVMPSLINGGAQENGFRAGTQNVPGIMGMAKAADISYKNRKENYKKVYEIKKRFIEGLKNIDNVRINGKLTDDYSPYILNVSFVGIKGEVLLHFLEGKNIYVSTGSACSSRQREKNGGSYVLKAMHLSNAEVLSGIRFSFSDDNTIEEVDYTINALKEGIKFLSFIRK